MERLRRLTQAFNLLPKGAVVFLPDEDCGYLEEAIKDNRERLYGDRLPWVGRQYGGLLCRGREFFALSDLDGWVS
jgi:hypothetical protein